MSGSVISELNELQNINKEISNLNKQLLSLRNRRKELEEKIKIYLQQTSKPGIKYKGEIILTKTQNIRIKQSKDDKEDAITSLLREHGVSISQNPNIVKELLETIRGPKEEKVVLKIKKQ
jgi:hypothetical protein